MQGIIIKERRRKLHLKKYLKTRRDKNPALFVSLKAPFHRLKTSGIESMLKKMGERCNVEHVHPHKFRRTMATVAIHAFKRKNIARTDSKVERK